MMRMLAVLLLLAAPAWAQASFLTPQQVPLLALLPPPPGIEQTQAEIAELHRIEQARTPPRLAQARADVAETVFDMFGPTLGPRFNARAMPAAAAFFARIGETEDTVMDPAKAGFGRLRPFLTDPSLQTASNRSGTGSYPSGHATRARLMAVVLGSMLPEYRASLFARAQDYAESRLILGVHHRSDIVAGGAAGSAIAAVLLNDPAFRAAYAPARDEARRIMGLN